MTHHTVNLLSKPRLGETFDFDMACFIITMRLRKIDEAQLTNVDFKV